MELINTVSDRFPMKKMRLIKYPGSKWVLIPDIREEWRKSGSKVFADVFGGSATVSLNSGAESVVYNEIDHDIYNLIESIKKSYEPFMEMVKQWLATPKNFREFRKQLAEERESRKVDPVYDAFKTFYRYNTTFGGMGETYSTDKEKSSFTGMGKTIGILPDIHKAISTWTLENLDYLEFIKKYSSEDIFFYIDPPYPGKNWYNNNFSGRDYRNLSNIRKEIKGKYLINFDRENDLIRNVFGEPQFIRKYENKNGSMEDMERPFRYVSFYTNISKKTDKNNPSKS